MLCISYGKAYRSEATSHQVRNCNLHMLVLCGLHSSLNIGHCALCSIFVFSFITDSVTVLFASLHARMHALPAAEQTVCFINID